METGSWSLIKHLCQWTRHRRREVVTRTMGSYFDSRLWGTL